MADTLPIVNALKSKDWSTATQLTTASLQQKMNERLAQERVEVGKELLPAKLHEMQFDFKRIMNTQAVAEADAEKLRKANPVGFEVISEGFQRGQQVRLTKVSTYGGGYHALDSNGKRKLITIGSVGEVVRQDGPDWTVVWFPGFYESGMIRTQDLGKANVWESRIVRSLQEDGTGFPNGWDRGWLYPYRIGGGGSERPFLKNGRWYLTVWNQETNKKEVYDFYNDIFIPEKQFYTEEVLKEDPLTAGIIGGAIGVAAGPFVSMLVNKFLSRGFGRSKSQQMARDYLAKTKAWQEQDRWTEVRCHCGKKFKFDNTKDDDIKCPACKSIDIERMDLIDEALAWAGSTPADQGRMAAANDAYAARIKVGDKIRTVKGGQIPGLVTKVTDREVHFEVDNPGGWTKTKTMIAPLSNVVKEELSLTEIQRIYDETGGDISETETLCNVRRLTVNNKGQVIAAVNESRWQAPANMPKPVKCGPKCLEGDDVDADYYCGEGKPWKDHKFVENESFQDTMRRISTRTGAPSGGTGKPLKEDTDHDVVFASDMGWKPGEWPKVLRLNGNEYSRTGEVSRDREGDIEYVVYGFSDFYNKSKIGQKKFVHVYND